MKGFQRVVRPVLGAECGQTFWPNFLDPEVLRVRVELEQGLTGVRHRHGVSNASPDFEELRYDFIDGQMRKSEEQFVDVIYLVIGFHVLTQSQICKG